MFDTFWELYPRKVGKAAAKKKYETKLKKYDQDVIYKGLEDHVHMWNANETEKKYIPHATTRLNQERFLDEIYIESDEIVEEKIYDDSFEDIWEIYPHYNGRSKKELSYNEFLNVVDKSRLEFDIQVESAKIALGRLEPTYIKGMQSFLKDYTPSTDMIIARTIGSDIHNFRNNMGKKALMSSINKELEKIFGIAKLRAIEKMGKKYIKETTMF